MSRKPYPSASSTQKAVPRLEFFWIHAPIKASDGLIWATLKPRRRERTGLRLRTWPVHTRTSGSFERYESASSSQAILESRRSISIVARTNRFGSRLAPRLRSRLGDRRPPVAGPWQPICRDTTALPRSYGEEGTARPAFILTFTVVPSRSITSGTIVPSRVIPRMVFIS